VSRARLLTLALLGLILRRRRRRRGEAEERLLPRAGKDPQAELAVVGLLIASACSAAGFITVYADTSIPDSTQLLGLSLALALLFLAAAGAVVAFRLVVTEEVVHDYPPPEHEPADRQLELLFEQSTERFTRRRLLLGTGLTTGAVLGTALVAPFASFGPVFDLRAFIETPWYRGRRLVGEDGRPLEAAEIDEADFYTAFPEGADRDQLGAPLVLVRLPASAIHLPAGRTGWAPRGILAYSKICTHAACAISLYRTPTFAPTEPGPALVCPCHYSTFDPATGGTVLFGPAGRPLPQLPLAIDSDGSLRAAGNFSGPVGPSWWGVRSRRPT
jgi:ubiquinol-cytochrome c reductase iron-sulfur subunit